MFGVTILIPTHNRAEGLRETLSAMCQLDRKGIDAEFIVIDNNSSDHTQQVVASFDNRLPIRYRFEPRKGKSCALNGALDEESLKDVVLFTDDDVTPEKDWLQEVVAACRKWPNHHVFGGKVISQWPDGKPPSWWDRASRYGHWTLGGHDYGDQDRLYPEDKLPCGPSTWVRRTLVERRGFRYDEKVGPQGQATVMGEDGIFVKNMRTNGFEPVYVPRAVVYHRIQASLVSAKGIRRRAWSQGKGNPYYNGPCHPAMLRESVNRWQFRRLLALGYACIRYGRAMVHWSSDARLAESLPALADIAYNIESLKRAGSLRHSLARSRVER